MNSPLQKSSHHAVNPETWKPIPTFEAYYTISNLGNVVSQHKRNKGRVVPHRIDRGGYQSVRLSKEGKTYTRFLHRLLAEAFIPNPHGLSHVHHISGNKLQNDLENLRWVSHKTNVVEAYKQGLNSAAKQIIDTSTGNKYVSITDAANAAGINYNTCCKRLQRNDASFTLKYLWEVRRQAS